MRRTVIVAIVALFAGHAYALDWYEGDYERCAAEDNTAAIVDCVGGLIDEWDGRLNAAYREVMGSMEGERAAQLRTAQRAWIAYRDANCMWYRLGEGTVAAIEASTCVFALTRDRATELEAFFNN